MVTDVRSMRRRGRGPSGRREQRGRWLLRWGPDPSRGGNRGRSRYRGEAGSPAGRTGRDPASFPRAGPSASAVLPSGGRLSGFSCPRTGGRGRIGPRAVGEPAPWTVPCAPRQRRDDHAHATGPQLRPSGGRRALRVPGGGRAPDPLRARGLPGGHLPETQKVQRTCPAMWACVQMSCHPELNQYIQDTLHCVKPLLEKNDVEKVVVVILDKEHRPVEKFVFEITQPPLLSISSDSLLSHVEQLLRAFILKISVCDAVLDHNPPGCTFTVLVHTREAATRNMEKIQVIKDFPWILADEQDVHMHDPRLIPLKTMTSDILKMQLYVEERAHKSS